MVSDFVETVTNGSRLNKELNTKLAECGLNRIRISIEALDAKGYEKIAGVKLDYDQFVDNIRDLYDKTRGKNCEIYIKIVDADLSQEQKERFYATYENICDRIFIDKVIPLWSDFEDVKNVCEIDSKTGLHGQEIKPVAICPYPFYSCVINPDGDVTLCCADWQRKFVAGNLREESFSEIWNGEKLRQFWINMLEGKKNDYEMCSKCVLPMFDCNDNIDGHAAAILQRIAGKERA